MNVSKFAKVLQFEERGAAALSRFDTLICISNEEQGALTCIFH